MLCQANMKNEINVTIVLAIQIQEVTGIRKTESNYMIEKNYIKNLSKEIKII